MATKKKRQTRSSDGSETYTMEGQGIAHSLNILAVELNVLQVV